MEIDFLSEARKIKEKIVSDRRWIHACAETGFELQKTKDYVMKRLSDIGYQPTLCGRCGVIAEIGKKRGKTVLLRADMDALPISEESGVSYSAQNGNMHACGHDMHTAMLLGAAKLLKAHEEEINGRIKLMFQPAEELLEGAKDMMKGGVLENPKPDIGIMMHVIPIKDKASGMVIVAPPGVSAPSADYFKIELMGKGCHGSMPSTGINPILPLAHTILALETIQTHEIPFGEPVALTVGKIHGGEAANVIPSHAVLEGSFRTYREETRDLIKKRVSEIATKTAEVYRATSKVTFPRGCPTLVNNHELAKEIYRILNMMPGKSLAVRGEEISNGQIGAAGSEDFAYISHQIPTIMLALMTESKQSLHHPKIVFDEEVLAIGSAVYAHTAFCWLKEQK